MTPRAYMVRIFRSLAGSPEHNRLAGTIEARWLAFDAMLQVSQPEELNAPWARAAYRELLIAERDLSLEEYEKGWRAVEEAKHWMLRGQTDGAALQATAVSLWRESKPKLSGWREKAVADLICDGDDKLRSDLAGHRENLIEAVRLLDDQSATTRHRIALRRRHLQNVFSILSLALATTILLSAVAPAPSPFPDPYLLSAVMTAGIIGACISVAQSLMTIDLEARIPAQMVGAFVVWMRPVVGAAAALAAFAFLKANSALKIFDPTATSPGVMLVVALMAGYSERFIVGAFEHVSDSMGTK